MPASCVQILTSSHLCKLSYAVTDSVRFMLQETLKLSLGGAGGGGSQELNWGAESLVGCSNFSQGLSHSFISITEVTVQVRALLTLHTSTPPPSCTRVQKQRRSLPRCTLFAERRQDASLIDSKLALCGGFGQYSERVQPSWSFQSWAQLETHDFMNTSTNLKPRACFLGLVTAMAFSKPKVALSSWFVVWDGHCSRAPSAMQSGSVVLLGDRERQGEPE